MYLLTVQSADERGVGRFELGTPDREGSRVWLRGEPSTAAAAVLQVLREPYRILSIKS